MRPSKNIHLLARMRKELGELTQEDIAKKIGVHVRKIRRIELGAQKLSRILAERISDIFEVDPDCLMKNDLVKGLRTRNGEKWTPKLRLEIQNRLKRWGDLEPDVRRAQRSRCAVLFRQYLEISNLIQQLPNPGEQLQKWQMLFQI